MKESHSNKPIQDTGAKERLIHALLREEIGGEQPPDVRPQVMSKITSERVTSLRIASMDQKGSSPDLWANIWRRSIAAAAAVIALSTTLFFVYSTKPVYPRIVKVDGPGFLIRKGQKREIHEGMPLAHGDQIETATDSRILIGYTEEATTLSLAPGTQLRVSSSLRGKRFLLEQGQMETTVAPQPSRTAMRIATPTAAIKVLGTRFVLSAYENRSAVNLLEGRVVLSHKNSRQSRVLTPGLTGSVSTDYSKVRLFREPAVTEGLLVYLPFDFAGGTARDMSGEENHGALAGTPRRRPGTRDGALNFDGKDDTMRLSGIHLAKGTAFSVGFWVDVDLPREYPNRTILQLDSQSGTSGRFAIDVEPHKSGVLRFHHPDGRILTFAKREYPWVQLYVVYDGKTALTLYQNGKQTSAHTSSTPLTINHCLFGQGPGKGDFFLGSIDEFRLYDRALSSKEVALAYESDLPIPE